MKYCFQVEPIHYLNQMNFVAYLINDQGKWETVSIPEDLRGEFLELLYECRGKMYRGVPVDVFQQWYAEKTSPGDLRGSN